MRIALVGGGPCCTAAYLELASRLYGHLSGVTIFDPRGILNSCAFNTESEVLLLNTSVGITSLSSHNDADFLAWLHDQRPELNARPESFVPRRLLREYALSRFGTARELLASFSCPTKLVFEEVTDVRELAAGGAWIETGATSHGPFNAVILGTGDGPRQPFEELEHVPGYVPSPYPESELLRRTAGAKRVLVLGTKLSAIDAALTLLRNTGETKIVLASPSGRLPAVRDQFLIHRPGVFHAESILRTRPRSLLRAAERAMVADLKTLAMTGGGRAPKPVTETYARLMQDIENCESARIGWQFAVGTFVDEINKLWPFLSTEEQRRMWEKYMPYTKHFGSAFPLQSAKRVAAAMAAERLAVRATGEGTFFRVSETGTFEGCGPLCGLAFDKVINAAGRTTSLQTAALYRNLLSRGNLLNEHGGLDVDPDTMRLRAIGGKAPIYAMGAPTFGSLFMTVHLRASVGQARAIVRDIAQTWSRRDYGDSRMSAKAAV